MRFCALRGFTASGVSFWAVVSFVTLTTVVTVGPSDTAFACRTSAGALSASEGAGLSLHAATIETETNARQERARMDGALRTGYEQRGEHIIHPVRYFAISCSWRTVPYPTSSDEKKTTGGGLSAGPLWATGGCRSLAIPFLSPWSLCPRSRSRRRDLKSWVRAGSARA